MCAAKAKGTYYKEKYYRLKARLGAKRAAMAIAHKILVAVFHILAEGTEFRELGPAAVSTSCTSTASPKALSDASTPWATRSASDPSSRLDHEQTASYPITAAAYFRVRSDALGELGDAPFPPLEPPEVPKTSMNMRVRRGGDAGDALRAPTLSI